MKHAKHTISLLLALLVFAQSAFAVDHIHLNQKDEVTCVACGHHAPAIASTPLVVLPEHGPVESIKEVAESAILPQPTRSHHSRAPPSISE